MSSVYNLLDPDEADNGITAAVAAIRAGDLVVMPTDTVYGVAADPFSTTAVDRLLRAKDRGRDTPPPVLIGSSGALTGLASDVDEQAQSLVDAFWPGPLSLVLRVQPSINWDLGETRGTVMLRMPDHDQALQLLRRTGPLAVSSANLHGRMPATSVEMAQADLGDRIAVYLDAGATPGSTPSTIIDLTRITPQLLRRGVITDEQLREVVPGMQVDIDGEPMPGEELLAAWEAEQARLDEEEARREAEKEERRARGEAVDEDEDIPFVPWEEGENPDDWGKDEPAGDGAESSEDEVVEAELVDDAPAAHDEEPLEAEVVEDRPAQQAEATQEPAGASSAGASDEETASTDETTARR